MNEVKKLKLSKKIVAVLDGAELNSIQGGHSNDLFSCLNITCEGGNDLFPTWFSPHGSCFAYSSDCA